MCQQQYMQYMQAMQAAQGGAGAVHFQNNFFIKTKIMLRSKVVPRENTIKQIVWRGTTQHTFSFFFFLNILFL